MQLVIFLKAHKVYPQTNLFLLKELKENHINNEYLHVWYDCFLVTILYTNKKVDFTYFKEYFFQKSLVSLDFFIFTF